jgi:hypothetical protein
MLVYPQKDSPIVVVGAALIITRGIKMLPECCMLQVDLQCEERGRHPDAFPRRAQEMKRKEMILETSV